MMVSFKMESPMMIYFMRIMIEISHPWSPRKGCLLERQLAPHRNFSAHL